MSLSPPNRRTTFLLAAAIAALSWAQLSEAAGSEKSASRPPERILAAGGDDVLWVVRTGQGDKGDRFDLLIRRPGGKWRTLSRFQGTPAAIAGDDGSLHLISGESAAATTFFSLSNDKDLNLRSMGPGGRWPLDASPSAMVPIGPLGKSASPGYMAVVPYESETTSAPATAPAGGSSGLIVLQTVDGDWEQLCRINDIPAAVGARISACAAGGWVYILVAADDKPNRLLAWNASDKKIEWTDVALSDQPSHPLSLAVLQKKASLITISQEPWRTSSQPGGAARQPKNADVELAILELEADKIVTKPQVVEDRGGPLVLRTQSRPVTCSLGDQLVVIWRAPKAYRCAIADLNGQVAENKEVSELLEGVPSFNAMSILVYFLWSIPPLLLAMILLEQKNRPPAVLVLPAKFAPGALPRRLAAIIIDWVPITFIASISLVIFSPNLNLTADKAIEMLRPDQQHTIPVEIVVAMVGSFAAWIVYGSIMESKFRATLGKMAMKLEVISLDGERPTIRQAIMRNLIRPIEICILPIMIITSAMSLMTRTRQRLGDLIARTVVVEKTASPGPRPESPDSDAADPPAEV